MRVINSVASRKRRKKILKKARGNRGARGKLIRMATEMVRRGEAYATRHRRKRKGDFRSEWVVRIGAATKQHGLSYSRFMHLLSTNNVILNRKMLSEMAIQDPQAFELLLKKVS